MIARSRRLVLVASSTRASLTIVFAACMCAAMPVAADPTAPARLSYVETGATIDSPAGGGVIAATLNAPIVDGDRLSTTSGRLEIAFGDGSIWQLDVDSRLDLLESNAGDAIVARLLAGSLRVAQADAGRALSVRIDTPAASVRLTGAGEYRIDTLASNDAPATRLSVIRGSAELATTSATVSLGAGEQTTASLAEAPGVPVAFNAADWDAFDEWSDARLRSAAPLTARVPATSYLPEGMVAYESSLAPYGQWIYVSSDGFCWQPYVSAGWRPYSLGRWLWHRQFGWTWISFEPWGWAPYHYGRWGFTTALGWYWIPGATWGPAWVSWIRTSDFVAWSPLGRFNQPVVPIAGSFLDINTFHHGPHARAWNVLPTPEWTRGIAVPRGVPGSLAAAAVPRRAPDPPAASARRRERDPHGTPPVTGGIDQAEPGGDGTARGARPRPEESMTERRRDRQLPRLSVIGSRPTPETATPSAPVVSSGSRSAGAQAVPRSGERAEPVRQPEPERPGFVVRRHYGIQPAAADQPPPSVVPRVEPTSADGRPGTPPPGSATPAPIGPRPASAGPGGRAEPRSGVPVPTRGPEGRVAPAGAAPTSPPAPETARPAPPAPPPRAEAVPRPRRQ